MRQIRPKLAMVKPASRSRRIPAEHRDQRISAIDITRSARDQIAALTRLFPAMTAAEKECVVAAQCSLSELLEKLVPMPVAGRRK